MVVRMNNYVEERFPGPGSAGRTKSLELSIDGIYRQDGHAVVGSGGTLHRERSELPTHEKAYFEKRGPSDADTLLEEAGIDRHSGQEFYRLTGDERYHVEFAEAVDVPEGHVGIVAPQEPLVWAGVGLDAPLVGPDADVVRALLSVEENSVLLQDGSSVAELVVVESA